MVIAFEIIWLKWQCHDDTSATSNCEKKILPAFFVGGRHLPERCSPIGPPLVPPHQVHRKGRRKSFRCLSLTALHWASPNLPKNLSCPAFFTFSVFQRPLSLVKKVNCLGALSCLTRCWSKLICLPFSKKKPCLVVRFPDCLECPK